MNYLGKRNLKDICPMCGNKFYITKHVNEYVANIDKKISFYQMRCASEDHVLTDYVSLYLNTTYYRRVTCTKSPDCLQLHLNFLTNESQVTVDVGPIKKNIVVEFKYLVEDCNSIDKLLERLEIYQAFS